jgi:hypothetical protein
MESSRWIEGMISPPAVTDTPRPISRLCTSLTSTARQLLCPRQVHLKDHHSLKKVAEVAKAKVMKLLIRNIGRTKHACIPKLLMIHIVINAVKMLNFFPTKGGISNTLSPKTIMSGETLD